MHINHCSNELVVATQGCGLYTVPTMTPPELVISENTSWTEDRFIAQNLRIATGATLTVTDATIQFAENVEVFVERGAKLDIRNSHWKARCDTRWDGIHVHGNASKPQPDPQGSLQPDDAGVVIIQSGSIIEDANTAVSTNAPDIKEGRAAFYGGVVFASNSTFKNNRRVAEFLRYDFDNTSSFVNCILDGEPDVEINKSIGVTIWACEGIEFRQNTFTNFDLEGIHGINFGALIHDGNHFEDCRTAGIGVYATNSAVFRDLQIGTSNSGFDRNTFVDNGGVHIDIASATFNTRILNNDITGSRHGIRIVGESERLTILGNKFLNQSGISCRVQNAQGSSHLVSCNEFNGRGFLGLGLWGDNQGTQFLGNTFEVENAFANVFNDGQIAAVQGDFITNVRADNCYNDNSFHLRTGDNSVSFNYLVEQGDMSCNVPDLNGQDFVLTELFDPRDHDCSEVIDLQSGTENQLIEIVDDILSLEGKTSRSIAEESLLISLRRQRAELEAYLIEQRMQSGNIQDLSSIISLSGGFDVADLIGVYQQMSLTQPASSLVNQSTEIAANFRTVQDLYMDQIGAEGLVNLSPEDRDMLLDLGKETSGLDPHVRALITLLTDERIEPELPQEMEEIDYRSLSRIQQQSQRFSVYPNPSTGILTIEDLQEKIEIKNYSIINIESQVIASGRFEGKQLSLDLESLVKGIYFIEFQTDADPSSSEILKLIVQ